MPRLLLSGPRQFNIKAFQSFKGIQQLAVKSHFSPEAWLETRVCVCACVCGKVHTHMSTLSTISWKPSLCFMKALLLGSGLPSYTRLTGQQTREPPDSASLELGSQHFTEMLRLKLRSQHWCAKHFRLRYLPGPNISYFLMSKQPDSEWLRLSPSQTGPSELSFCLKAYGSIKSFLHLCEH